ncbi:MAG: hypothetical protein V2I27_11300 [Erythrobacter sp.]|nr:hypothetical protein [Erythrobacter sp.]
MVNPALKDSLALLTYPAASLALLTLIALEVVLGVDNLIFIAILSNKLPEHQQERARRVGLLLARGMRIGLVMLIGWIVTVPEPLFDLGITGPPVEGTSKASFEPAFSGRDLILLAGGLFALCEILNIVQRNRRRRRRRRRRSQDARSAAVPYRLEPAAGDRDMI